MKRLAFRIAVAALTFFIGIATTKVPYQEQHLNTISTLKQELPIREIKLSPEIESQHIDNPISDKFEKVGDLPVALDENDLSSLQFIDERNGWLSINGKLWRTRDSGKHWQLIFTSPKTSDDRHGWLSRFVFINSRTGWLVSSYKLYKTEDGGSHWNEINQPIPYNYKEGLPVGLANFMFLKDGKHGWVVGDRYRAVTRKERELFGYPHPRYSSIDSKRVLTSLIYYTEDGGRSWTQQPLTSGWYDIDNIYALDSSHAWASGLAGFFYLENGRWIHVKSGDIDDKGNPLVGSLDVAIGAPTDYPCSIYFVNSKVGWLTNSNGYVGKSVNGGRSWTDVTGQFGGQQYSSSRWNVRVYFANTSNGLGLDRDGKLRTTTDSGVTWTVVDKNAVFSDAFFLDAKHGWAVSKEGLYRIIPNK